MKSLEGNVNLVYILIIFFIVDRILWNKIVFFFFGFIWLGFKVFDVLLENDFLVVISIYELLSLVVGVILRGL